MIISDVYQVAFIHIPKCGGSTIQSYLQKYDDLHSAFSGRLFSHPQLGSLDLGHIPLFVLEKFYPLQFQAIQKYWSFAVVRDPFSRFPSSVSQRLKMYGVRSIQELSISELGEVIDRDIEFLSRHRSRQCLLPSEYIHFQKQSDYVYIARESPISRLFSLENLHLLSAELKARFAPNLAMLGERKWSLNRVNQTFVFRNDLFRTMYQLSMPARSILRPLVPGKVRQKLRCVSMVPRDERYRDLFRSKNYVSFINDYYSEDIQLYERVKGVM